MGKSKSTAFGPRVRKVVELVVGGKEAEEISDKARKGIHEFIEAEEAHSKAEETETLKGVPERWGGTFGLNKKAMSTLVALSKMDDKKKADFLRTFLPGLEAILPDQMDLFASANPEDSKTPSETTHPAPSGSSPPLQ